mgnify:CR=1 FL=1
MNNVLSVEFLQQASDVIKVLGHPQRLKIIEYLEKGCLLYTSDAADE